jgi:hypothetical protein
MQNGVASYSYNTRQRTLIMLYAHPAADYANTQINYIPD